jgi:hypothetical protein
VCHSIDKKEEGLPFKLTFKIENKVVHVRITSKKIILDACSRVQLAKLGAFCPYMEENHCTGENSV